jgi:MFS family permease
LIRSVERRSRIALVGLGSFLLCAGLALMPLGQSFLFAAVTIAVWTVGEMLALPLLSAIVADRAGSGNHGRYMGAYNVAFAVAFVFAPAGGAHLYETLGPTGLWYTIGVLGVLLWIGALGLARPLSDKPVG